MELSLQGNEWSLNLRKDVSITFNKSFLLAYAYYNQVKVPEELIEQSLDDIERDSTVFRTAVYKMLKESPVEINYNPETFINELISFGQNKRADMEKEEENGMLKLYPQAVLGMFPQAGSYLVPDYLHLLEEDGYDDIEQFFLSRTRQEEINTYNNSPDYFRFLNKVKEEETFTPFKLDAHQENALKAIKQGNSLVVQGPPGTGKSQLISNLISDFIARGKRVLLVCQKRAALDVVYERLSAGDMAPFAALVHDFKNDRKTIFSQINDQIERVNEYQFKNNSLDAIQLERKFLQASRKIDQIAEQFEEFKQMLFDESEAGVSVKELYLNSDREGEMISLKQEYRSFPMVGIEDFELKLRHYFTYHNKFNRESYTWRSRKRFAGFGMEELNKMKSILKEIPVYQEEISKKVEKLLGAGMELKAAEKVFLGRENLKEMLRHLKDDITFGFFQHIVHTRDVNSDSFPDLLWLSTMRRTLMGCFDSPGPELSLETKDLGAFQKALQQKMKSRRRLFASIKWHLFSKDKTWLNKVLASNNLRRKGKDYNTLERMVDFRLNLEHNVTKLKSTKWLTEIPEFYLRDVFDKWFEREKDAVTSYLIFDSFRNFKEYFNTTSISMAQFIQQVNSLYEIVIDIPTKMDQWRVYLRDARIDMILNDAGLNVKMISTLNDDFDGLCDFDNLKQNLSEAERAVIDRLIDVNEMATEDELLGLFKNSLRMAWIDHIETKYPILRSINSLQFERMQADLQQAVKDKLNISKEITLLKTRERTYANVEFNRLNNMVTYRDLAHQVNKSRCGPSVNLCSILKMRSSTLYPAGWPVQRRFRPFFP
ncbi:MAG: AAA family ATPase [Cyclobacteriaceae bacterium]|nr:AAA family ATPase [Cyclobacteriaceae bacterium]